MFSTSKDDKSGLRGTVPMARRPGNLASNGKEPLSAADAKSATPFGTSKADEKKPGAAGLTKSPYTLPSVSLPSASGSLRGMGEKFSVNPATGTGSTSVPVPTSPGRRGAGPSLSLSYDSGSGTGAFGMGWSLSTSSIRRKTDKGIPRYRDDCDAEEDVFQISGAENLVPELEWSGRTLSGRKVHLRCDGQRMFKVTAYQPRIEGSFQRIWKVADVDTGETHWEVKAPDNGTTIYGDSAACRVADPDDPLRRVFEWLPSRSYDEKGNLIVFEYKAENDDEVDVDAVDEQHRTKRSRSAHRYLKCIKYGNTVSRVSPSFAQDGTDWLFQVVLDYGEHDGNAPTTVECRPWTSRADPFSSRRAGFEIRQYRLCSRVLMFHHFPDERGIGRDCVVSAMNIEYEPVQRDETTGLAITTVVRSFTQEAWRRREGGGYDRASLPPIDFTYSMPQASDVPQVVEGDSLSNLPIGFDDAAYQIVDLDSQGLAGVVARTNGGLLYVSNNGEGEFGAAETLPQVPSLVFSADSEAWMDLDGSGKADLVKLSGPGAPGFYGHDWDEDDGWQTFQPFETLPNIAWGGRNVKLMDLTGDGLTDVLVMDGDMLSIYYGCGKSGFTDAEFMPPPAESGPPRLVFWDGAEAMYVADMSGDGLADIVRIRNDEVCYWPSLGYGQFGRRVTMRNAPTFDHGELFDQSLLRLADVDGSGTTDIVYLGGHIPVIYQNLSGNGWSEGTLIHGFPSVNTTSNVQVVDLLGKGTACLVWSSKLPSDSGSQIRYLDLMEQRPYLLVKIENNTGIETYLTYMSSSLFYARDKKAGRPWLTHLPFPVHCVEKSETIDRISGNLFTTRYAYHDGYFDGVEREFRGFGFVESWDTEHYSNLDKEQKKCTNIDQASHIPPVLSRTWYHNGQFHHGHCATDYYRHEYYRDLGLHPDLADVNLSDTELPTSIRMPDGEKDIPHTLNLQERQEAFRALKGSPLRAEVYSLDGTSLQDIPVSATQSSYVIEQRQPLIPENKHAVFMIHAKESLEILYDRKLYRVGDRMRLDPRIQHSLVLETDFFGNITRQLAVNYGRRYDDPNPMLKTEDRERQRRAYAKLVEASYTNMIDTEEVYVLPAIAESSLCEVINILSITNTHKRSGTACWVPFEAARQAAAELTLGEFDIPFDNFDGPYPSKTRLYRRMAKKSRSIYRRDDLTGPLPLGVIEPLMLPHKNHDLVFSDAQAQLYVSGGKLRNSELQNVFRDEGAYHRFPGEDGWWSNSGDVFFSPEHEASPEEELRCARENFFVLWRARTPWHTPAAPAETKFLYDRYNLLAQDVVDPYGNIMSVGERDIDPAKPLLRKGHDYRLLAAFLRMDANRNRVEVAFDILGNVVASATRGKPEENRGDSLHGIKLELDDKEIKSYYRMPRAAASDLLGKATSRSVYDVHAYCRTKHLDYPEPNWSSSMTRETHESELARGEFSRVFVGFSYADGTGRPIQVKAQCEPGPLITDSNITDVEKSPEEVVYDRWLTSSWVIYNNKGSPVRSYEPFLSSTHGFQDRATHGVSPIMLYDALGRGVAVINPDHTWTKVVTTPWGVQRWDRTDTVLVGDPAEDEDVGGYVGRLRREEYMPTWYAQRSGGQMGVEEERAAKACVVHARTPSMVYFDALGRECVKFEILRRGGPDRKRGNGIMEDETVRQAFHVDVMGLPYKVVDTMGRTASRICYNFGGEVIREEHMDNGDKWTLKDTGGTAIRTWNGRGEVFQPVLDRARRVCGMFVGNLQDGEHLIERTVYGEDRPRSEEANSRGRIVETVDQTGVSRTPRYDFKGNVLASTMQLARRIRGIIDWRDEVDLEETTYEEVVYHNALNKVIKTVLPDGTETQYTYNDRMMAQTVSTTLGGTTEKQVVIGGVSYNAKGQRTCVLQGNGVKTRVSYDELTFKAKRIVSTRRRLFHHSNSSSSSDSGSSGGSDSRGLLKRRKRRRPRVDKLQDLRYTYDASGNITNIKDNARQTVLFRNQRVDPSQSFWYDSLCRLVEATGREHVSQMAAAKDGRNRPGNSSGDYSSGDHVNDDKPLARYKEQYEYDTQGNILALRHETPSESRAWTRLYEYNESSAILEGEKNNRLSWTHVGRNINEYRYEGPSGVTGSMTWMPTVGSLEYDYSDRMVASSSQPDKSEGSRREATRYRYDATGQRVRKVTERTLDGGNVVPVKETVYIGGAFEVFRRYSGTGETTTEIHSLTIAESGRRLLLVDNRTIGSDTRAPATVYRYQLSNHQGSATMEVDQDAKILSYEEYTPYGLSSLRSTHHQTEIPKRYRFLGKELDDSGLYHLGIRYYAAWLGRFTSADPKGAVDGLNLYQYAQSNPVMLTDPGGSSSGPPIDPSTGWTQEILESRKDLVRIAQEARQLPRELWAQTRGALGRVYGMRSAQDFARYLQAKYNLGHVRFERFLAGPGGGPEGASWLDTYFREWEITGEHKLVSIKEMFRVTGEYTKRGRQVFKDFRMGLLEQAETRAGNIARTGEELVSVIGITMKNVAMEGKAAAAFTAKIVEHMPREFMAGIDIIHESSPMLQAARRELNAAAKIVGPVAEEALMTTVKVAKKVGGPLSIIGLVAFGLTASSEAHAAMTGTTTGEGGETVGVSKGERLMSGLGLVSGAADIVSMGVKWGGTKTTLLAGGATMATAAVAAATSGAATGALAGSYVADVLEEPMQGVLGEAAGAGAAAGTGVLAGAAAGAVVGALIGSAVPVLGTAAGAAIGGIAGAVGASAKILIDRFW
ncbi:hypothetical protein ACO1O0_006024 [Amphichorda felina]